jgi:hypothetical protein
LIRLDRADQALIELRDSIRGVGAGLRSRAWVCSGGLQNAIGWRCDSDGALKSALLQRQHHRGEHGE